MGLIATFAYGDQIAKGDSCRIAKNLQNYMTYPNVGFLLLQVLYSQIFILQEILILGII